MNSTSTLNIDNKHRDFDGLIGLPTLMRMALTGGNLTSLAQDLSSYINTHDNVANALMDLSIVLQLQWQPDAALAIQKRALEMQQLYHQPAAHAGPKIRLLALMGAGDLMSNAPLAFLVEDSDVALDMLYVAPGQPLPTELPAHDVLFIAVSESDQNRALLKHIAQLTSAWPHPVLNRAQHIAMLSRNSFCSLLRSSPGLSVPLSARITRQTLQQIGDQTISLTAVLEDGVFPIIARPLDSHAGRGLSKLNTSQDVEHYLKTRLEPEFYISRFIDYHSADGQFRKYRVALIDGQPYACHMGISEQWMIHYLNAGMMHSADKRGEEANFMASFDQSFAIAHARAFSEINRCLGLDYLVIDCAETSAGELLIFEVDTSAVVHAMDSVDIFPYKHVQMRKVFTAFRALLLDAMQRQPQLLNAQGAQK